MKKMLCVAFLFVSLLSITGCKSLHNYITDTQNPGYLSGVISASIYLDTKDEAGPQFVEAAELAYSLLTAVTTQEVNGSIDDFVNEKINEMFNEHLEYITLKEIVLYYYQVAITNRTNELGSLDQNGDVVKVLVNFKRGVDVVLDNNSERVYERKTTIF